MKFRSLRKWDDPQNSTSLIYFSQLLEEMLFDFSLDTYKTSILHAGLLCVEALQTIDEVEAGNIAAPNVAHVSAELYSNLEKDPVSISLLPFPVDSFASALKNKKTTPKEARSVVELIAVQLTAKKYRKKNQELLSEAIRENKPLAEIRRLTRSFITTLSAIGFSTKFIREKSQNFFCFGSNRIAGNEAIDDFLEIFQEPNNEYIVTFRVGKLFETFSAAFQPVSVAISAAPPAEINNAPYVSFLTPSDQLLYATISNISAKDPYSARQVAEKRLKLCATFLNTFHHKENPSWQMECVVKNINNDDVTLVKSQINPMHKCGDLLQAVAAKKLMLFMSDFSLEKGSFSKFVRSAELHSMALSSNASENQIINLWISLESLVPSESKSENASNIEHIVDSLMPFLNERYIQKLINNLVKDLLRWNAVETKKALRPITGRKLIDKLAKVMILPEHAAICASIEATFGDFHLLRDRFEHLKNLLKSPDNILAALDAHKMRLEWQIRRIYRARNIIVHSGKTPAHTQPLIEHTHDYLDTVLSRLIELASKPQSINSVAQGFKFVDMKYANYISNLKRKGLSFNSGNIHELLFM